MRNILGLSALAAYSTPPRRVSTSITPPDHGEPPNFLTPLSEYDHGAWTNDPARPLGSRSSDSYPFITPSKYLSTVLEQPWFPIPVTQPGTVSVSTLFLTSIITPVEVTARTCPKTTEITITVEQTVPIPTTVYQQKTTTVNSSPACYSSGTLSPPNAAACNGKGCEITFEKGEIIHWELLTKRTPLVTHCSQSTCVAVVCNTTEFSLYYARSATSCDRPPCPSNSLNCECKIVIGPINLPDGRITSVTQAGPSGWNLNLGPAATAQNIGHCGPNGPVCDAVPTTLFTPLVYTDTVKVVSTTAWRNDTETEATDFLLPQLTEYFPANDPLGMCTKIKLSLRPTTTFVRKRDDVATVGGDGITTWPGCETLTDDANAKRGLVARETLYSDSIQLPICSSKKALSTTTVTATVHRDTGPSTAVETLARSAARRQQGHRGRLVWVTPLLILVGQGR